MQLSLPLSVSQPFASTIDEMFAIWQTVHRILQPSSNLSNLKARGCQNWQGRIIKGQIRSWPSLVSLKTYDGLKVTKMTILLQ